MPFANREKDRAYRKSRRDIINQQAKARRQANPEKYQAQYKARYKRNSEAILARAKAVRRTPLGWAKNKHSLIQIKAKAAGLEYNLTIEDFLQEISVCPVLGIALEYSSGKENAVSVDRVDNSKGYTKDNIVLMSDRANRLKKDATLDELILLGKWAEKQKAERKP